MQAIALTTIKYSHIYIHLPFCDTICHYCDFYVVRSKEGNSQQNFFRALKKEVEYQMLSLSSTLETIYFGGGTPSESPAEEIENFLIALEPYIQRQTEITLEANPTSITEKNLLIWKRAGINRLSIGIQSLQNSLLKKIGRVHSREEALEAIKKAQKYFTNISCDLIYGIPSQTVNNLKEDAQELASLEIQHLSAYTLTLEPQHFLYSKLPTSDFTMEQSQTLYETLHTHGFTMYEASNYSRAGFESRHNQCYWRGKPYLAIGPSAHGFDGKEKRWKNISSWQEYTKSLLEKNHSAIDWEESLSKEQRINEYLLTRLRTKRGISFQEFMSLFGFDLLSQQNKLFQALEKSGYGFQTKIGWTPTFQGLMLADEISLKLSQF